MFTNIHYSYKSNKIFLWEIQDGERVLVEEDYKPYCYIQEDAGEFKDLYGLRCRKRRFHTYFDQKEYIKDHETFEGDVRPESRFLIDRYYDKDLLLDMPKLHVHNVDIETDSEGGMSDASRLGDEILLLTVHSSKLNKYYVFGQEDFDDSEYDDVEYILCGDEKTLLKKYFAWHRKNYPDVITGWNTDYFDVPYIIDRATLLFNERFAQKYSPVNHVREDAYSGERKFEIGGIAQLDYLIMYKKYSGKNLDNFRLNTVAEKELGEKKLEFEGSLFDLWKTDWKKYTEYNIKDVKLVKGIDEKNRFIELVQTQAYICKVPLNRVASAIAKLDNYMIAELKTKKIVLPTKKYQHQVDIPGGYVSEPLAGFYSNVTSFDFTALYPHIIFHLNLSPETYVGRIKSKEGNVFTDIDLSQIIDNVEYMFENEVAGKKIVGILTGAKIRKLILKSKVIISANGLIFRSTGGFLPKIVHEVFDKRDEYKQRMLKEKQLFKDSGDAEHGRLQEMYNARNLAMKTFANSIYGVLANKSFRLFNPDFASAITLTGQKLSKFTSKSLDDFFKEKFDIDKNVTIYQDTDSCYLDYTPVIEKFGIPKDNVAKYVKSIDIFNEKMIYPLFDKIFHEFSYELHNNPENYYHFKREKIARSGIWTSAKKYALYVLDSEGYTYEEPEVEITGMEIVRSSTPSFCREKIKEVVKMIFDSGKDKATVMPRIKEIHDEFKKASVEDIAFPRGLNHYEKYILDSGKLAKGCLIQVRAAKTYNDLIDKYDLFNKYGYICKGEKIKFIYVSESPNSNFENVIGFPEVLPEEFGIHDKIDYHTQWEKSFMSPIQVISKSIGWGSIDISIADMEEFF